MVLSGWRSDMRYIRPEEIDHENHNFSSFWPWKCSAPGTRITWSSSYANLQFWLLVSGGGLIEAGEFWWEQKPPAMEKGCCSAILCFQWCHRYPHFFPKTSGFRFFLYIIMSQLRINCKVWHTLRFWVICLASGWNAIRRPLWPLRFWPLPQLTTGWFS